MEPRLIPFNAWIALVTGDGAWPAPLRDMGYRLAGLEWPVTTSAGSVVVDGLGTQDGRNEVLAAECKGGQNVKDEQAKKYAAMTPEDVARQMTAASGAKSVQPVFVCVEGAESRIRLGLSALGLSLPVIVVGRSRARVDDPTGGTGVGMWDVELPGGPPPRLIPVDADSPETEYKEILVPALVAAARRNHASVTVDQLLDSSMQYWQSMGRNARERIRKKAVAALRVLAAGEFKDFCRVEKGGPEVDREVVRILKSPADFDPRGETQGWQALQRRGQRALRGRPPKRVPGQTSLEDLGLSISGEGS